MATAKVSANKIVLVAPKDSWLFRRFRDIKRTYPDSVEVCTTLPVRSHHSTEYIKTTTRGAQERE